MYFTGSWHLSLRCARALTARLKGAVASSNLHPSLLCGDGICKKACKNSSKEGRSLTSGYCPGCWFGDRRWEAENSSQFHERKKIILMWDPWFIESFHSLCQALQKLWKTPWRCLDIESSDNHQGHSSGEYFNIDQQNVYTSIQYIFVIIPVGSHAIRTLWFLLPSRTVPPQKKLWTMSLILLK